tara:strand:+ start:1508 stop:1762 length:255 start_codon:yes stop_codon:yes gene_type:complete
MTPKGYQFLFQELTFFEALTLLETAALLRVFPLGTRSSVARFWASSRFLHGCLALVSLHFTPLTTDELEQLFLASRPDGFLGPG